MAEDRNEDLSGIVTAVARPQLANHPLTRSYLEAGMRLVDREFFAPVNAPEGFTRPLSTLTRENIIAEVANEPTDLPRRASLGSFRDRWTLFPSYLSDLARYTLRIRRWSLHTQLAHQAVPALSGGDFVAAVQEIAYRDMASVTGIPSTALRFRFLLTAWAEQDEQLRGAMTSVYRDITAHWSAMCEKVFAARGLRLRPGVSFEDLAILLTALAEGLALRAAGDPGAPVLDHARRRSILGVAALALFAGMVDAGDGRTLPAYVAELVGD